MRYNNHTNSITKSVFSHDIYIKSDFQIPVNVLQRENITVLENAMYEVNKSNTFNICQG